MKTIKLILSILTCLTLTTSAFSANDNPLFVAVEKGDKAAVEALLSKGADVNAKYKYLGDTPLHHAAVIGYTAVAELLLAKGVDVNARNYNGLTPLAYAIGYKQNAMAELLRKRVGK